MKDVVNDFELLTNNDIIYLDNAATSQKPKYVIKKVNEYYSKYNANPHRGSYDLSISATREYDKARNVVKNFINAKYDEEIVFTKNATESLNLIAYSYGLDNINENDEIILSIMEHHSNLVPWQMVCKNKKAKLKYLYLNNNYEIDQEELSKITKNTKIVCITHVSNVTGTINDIKKIIDISHKNGAVVIVDASQSVAHMKIDVQKLDADFLVFSGHKMLANMGVGVLYAKRDLLKEMKPFLMGGDMIEYVYEQETSFASIPSKFEAGTQNVGAVISLSSAIEYINKIGFDNIIKYERQLIDYARKEMEKLDFLDLYYTSNIENHTSVIAFNIKGVHAHDVASILNSYNICIRSGHHCAQPLHRYLNLDSTCRASFYIYNTKEDIDRLIDGLKKVNNMFEKYKRKYNE